MANTPPLLRPDLAAIAAYQPGRRPDQIAREFGLERIVKLSSNELPFALPTAVSQAIANASNEANRYPDAHVGQLRDALATRLGITPNRIATACGSVSICEQIATATCTPGDEIIFGWRSFEAYPLIAAQAGAVAVHIANTPDHRLDTKAMAAAVTERTKLIFVCTPNNPTGTSLTQAELAELVAAVPPTVLIAIDEAYHEFATDPDAADGLSLVETHPNVIVLRTFSKAWGLAGLRIGYALATPEIAGTLRAVGTPFGSSSVAQAAALAALGESEAMHQNVTAVVEQRAQVFATLHAICDDIPESQANFLWLPLGEHSSSFARAMEERGVILRPFPGEGVRATIGTASENEFFLTAAVELLPRSSP